ncbi:MAG: sulfatase family protein [Bacteroidia bacterium]
MMKLLKYALLVFVICTCSISLLAQRPSGKPNIVVIISDDHAYQAISAYGNRIIKTPAIDRIATEGVKFSKGYVTNSICGPSRAVILTGKYSHKNGFKDNVSAEFNHGQDNFAKQLQKVGYQTAWIGKLHLGKNLEGFNFFSLLPGQGSYYNPDFIGMDGKTTRKTGYVTNVITDEAIKWLDQRDTSMPFCLVIGHKATHRTWMPDTADLGRYDDIDFPLPINFYDNYKTRVAAAGQDMSIAKTMRMGLDLKMYESEDEKIKDFSLRRMNASQREKYEAYYAKIQTELNAKNLSVNTLTEWKYQRYLKDYYNTAASLDRNIGRTLDYLDLHQLSQNTIVIYLSDQGFYLGEHGWFDKRWMYEESFRTPMVMRYPGVIKAGTTNNDFILNLDIAPTLLDAAGIKVPADMQGNSFLPFFSNKKLPWRNEIYYHYYENGEHSVSPHFGVKTKRYKLIRFYKRVDGWELFDLEKDKREENNLYGKKGYEQITASMKKLLSEQIDKFEDEEAKALK